MLRSGLDSAQDPPPSSLPRFREGRPVSPAIVPIDAQCYNPLLSGRYLQQVTDCLLTITPLGPIAVAIAKSVDSYLATSIARLL